MANGTRLTTRTTVFTIAGVLLLVSSACSLAHVVRALGNPWLSQYECIPPIAVHKPSALNAQTTVDWQLADVCTSQTRASIMATTGGRLHILAQLGEASGLRLHTLDADTGSSIWHGEFDAGRVIAAQGNVVVTGAIGQLIANEASDGQELWRTDLPRSRSVTDLVIQDGVVFASAVQDQHHMVGFSDGTLIESSDIEPFTRIYVDEAGRNFALIHNRYQLARINGDAASRSWSIQLTRPLYIPPSFYMGTIYLRQGARQGNILAVSSATGQLIWFASEQFVSNVAVGASGVYGLTETGELVRMDHQSGKATQLLDFSNQVLTTHDADLHPRPFTIALSEGESKIFVNLGDSWQLFAIDLGD